MIIWKHHGQAVLENLVQHSQCIKNKLFRYYAKERTINEIKIIWKYPPLAFDISFYKQEWGVLYR
jgi:hypothetical protein